MSDPQERLAALSPEKRALLLKHLAAAKTRVQIARRERPDPLPPSFAQQRLWLLDQMEPGSANYNVPAAAWMHGAPDLDVLQRALDAVVARHESLRTTFPSHDGTPRQHIAPELHVPIARHDVSHTEPHERREAALAIARKEATTGFDLSRGPLMRTLVVKLTEDEHLLVLNFHHVIVDGWSLSTMFRELATLYEAFAAGRPSPLEELPLQYADYALWQREWMQGETLKTQLDYWTERLANTPPVLELPSDRPRPAVQSYRGDVVRVSIPNDLLEIAKQRSREEGATLFMTFLAALDAVLFRYSGQTDLVVGSGIAGRNREEIEPLVGYFVNTLALRADVSGNPTFRELLGRVKESTLGAYGHQDLPIERLIEELHVERSLSHSPLFQVMVFFQNLPDQDIRVPGLQLVQLHMDDLNSATARCDLALFVEQNAGRLDILFEYATDLFDAATVRAFGEHLATLLRGAMADPTKRISELPLLSEAERHELLTNRMGDRAAVPDATMAQLVEQQTVRTPDALAVTFAQESLTYAQLDARANAFADALRTRGAQPGTLVGVHTDRGLDMLIAVLGILKTGAAYLPLDPSYPTDRIAFMVEDSGATLVVENGLRIDARDGRTNAVPPDTAYVIYTSGSTGKPKGVAIPHRGAVNFLLAMQREPGITPRDVVCAITTLSFDISVLELLLPLTVGASTAISDRATATDGKRLAQFIRDSRSAIVQATPASWRMLLDAGWEGDPKLKLLCGGEPLPRDLADALLGRAGELWNVYGPTETTVWSTVERITRGGAITVGRPIRNMRMYVADANMQLVPDGVPGELLIGGVGLAHGYVNREELTADRFVADPFDPTPGARVYRTGDVARWLRDGRLEILGRSDNQIKLRGFRIELGEIEAALREHATVRQAVVIAREDRPGDKRLAAYVVPEHGVVAIADLRAHLKAVLPEYMVPSAFVVMESLPISPNGKVDRRALPVPEAAGLDLDSYVAPRTDEEQQLAKIWSEVLGIERIGIDDDFFAVGGHSLLATQLIARVSKAFELDVPLRRLFESPTIAQFAAWIVSERLDSVSSEELNALLQDVEGLSDAELRALLGGGA